MNGLGSTHSRLSELVSQTTAPIPVVAIRPVAQSQILSIKRKARMACNAMRITECTLASWLIFQLVQYKTRRNNLILYRSDLKFVSTAREQQFPFTWQKEGTWKMDSAECSFSFAGMRTSMTASRRGNRANGLTVLDS